MKQLVHTKNLDYSRDALERPKKNKNASSRDSEKKFGDFWKHSFVVFWFHSEISRGGCCAVETEHMGKQEKKTKE